MLDFIKYNKLNVILGILFVIIVSSCGGSEGEDNSHDFIEPEVITPSNLSLTIDIVGLDSENPNGDGTGVITCTATATDAIEYEFKFGNGDEITSATGTVEYKYTERGTNNYIVSVIAFSKTGDFINTFQQIKVTVQRAPFENLIFSDEFDVDGSPDDSKWNYNIGTGDNGWGNGEKEYYTDRSENVIVEDGFLKITAIKENFEGSQYTSTRMLTQGKFEFTYGKVEVKAKLPFGNGTWPAIWMLGANIETVGWPACGEIDIMEHWGYNQGTVQSALHTISSYGSTTNHGAQFLEDVSSEFHVYAVEWDEEEIVFSVDDKVHYTYNPSVKNDETWPFTTNQFLILNVAMGGSWFEIDPNFTESSMLVDYVRVYQ